jgi:hypothetical protein
MTDLVTFARAAAEARDLDELAEIRAQKTSRMLAALEGFFNDDALPTWAAQTRDFHKGVLATLKAFVAHAGHLVTGASVLVEVRQEAYRWAVLVGLAPTISSNVEGETEKP